MDDYTTEELIEAMRAVNSIIHKCEKAQEKFAEGNSHHTLLHNRLKAMYISKSLIEKCLSAMSQTVLPTAIVDSEPLLENLGRLHSTKLGVSRIKRNLGLDEVDVITWCIEKIKSPNSDIKRRGKNWYIDIDGCIITVNAQSYTIITADKKAT